MTVDLNELYPHIKKFASLFEVGPGVKWAFQIKKYGDADVSYHDQKRELREMDWVDHFQQKPIAMGNTRTFRAGIALRLKLENSDDVKLLVVDCDNINAVMAVFESLMPVLDRMGVEYIWESSGLEGERGHLFIKTFCNIKLQRLWMEQIFDKAGLDPRDRKMKFEIFPTLKPNFILRAPGAVHMRTGKTNECMFKERNSNDPIEIMKMFADCKPLQENEMRASLITKAPEEQRRVDLAKVRRSLATRSTFHYTPRHLPLPVQDLPTVIKSVASNCQAVNKILNLIVNDRFANERGGNVHDAGLYLWGMAQYNDLIHNGKHGKEGRNWAESFFTKYRSRAWDSHSWDSEILSHTNKRDRTFTGCAAWERAFGMCEGCPYEKRVGFRSPKQLYWGKPTSRTALRELKLVTADWVRKNTFPQVRNRIQQLLTSGDSKRILVCSPQGTGKSVMIDDAAIDAARMGKKVIISVPTGDLAIEHKIRIDQKGKAFGIKAFVLGSQPKLFEKFVPVFSPGLVCPEAENIAKHKDLGISTMVYKEKYCQNCPWVNECPFPNQYTQCQEDEYQIVIVQHAHFTSAEAMENILKKHFDILFVDEAIVDALITQVKARESEWELLEALKDTFPWAADLAHWMKKGGYPPNRRKIFPQLEEMEQIKTFFTAHSCEWRLPTFIRYYNNAYLMDSNIGIWVFTPLPTDKIPVCVITDATPPLEIYQLMLDDKNIEVYGSDEILDYRKMNAKNKVIQVLDASMSKASLRGPVNEVGDFDYVRFFEILDFIADKARNEYKERKILITVYGGEFWTLAEAYIQRTYPDIGFGNKIILGKMSIGTNKFEDCDVQFLVAGVYLSGQDFHMQAYKLRIMANYWNLAKGRPPISNMFPYGVGKNARVEREEETICRVESISNHVFVFEYPEFKYQRPLETFHELAERFMIAKTQQSLRLRYNNDLEKISYIFGNYFMPSFLITDSVLEEDLLGYLRIADGEH